MTSVPLPPEYIAARRVLLTALRALEAHLDALVLVGAQAVYLHTGNADLTVAPTTTDADIAIAPSRLADEPLLYEALRRADFVPGANPGTWHGCGSVAVDLMVPGSLSGNGGRRGARLSIHGNRVARRTPGLEPTIVDNEPHKLSPFEADDCGPVQVRVAGPAALLVTKLVKIEERRSTPARQKPKDGLDILRLLQVIDMPSVGENSVCCPSIPWPGRSPAKLSTRFETTGPGWMDPLHRLPRRPRRGYRTAMKSFGPRCS